MSLQSALGVIQTATVAIDDAASCRVRCHGAVAGISARLVAETMSHRITGMNPGQGFTANIVTALLVIGASSLGLPVSTTHVSCGALFGIGTVTRQARWRTIGEIVLAWLITLPVAGLLGAAFALLSATLG
jgi:PiT family inorganic phosphate transporter